MKRTALPAVTTICLALSGAYSIAAAQQSSAAAQPSDEDELPVLEAYRLTDGTDVQLDGRIVEEFWSRAVPISDFTQQDPVEGGEPSERTEVWVVYDEDNLYIGAIIYDDPEGILAFQRERDASLGTDDRFMWILDTFRDGRTGYFFEINAAGLMGDGLMSGSGGGRGGFGGGGGGGGFSGGSSSKAWDGIWEARTARRPDGWSAEIRIPFRTLNFDPNSDTWGINFQRTIRRRNEEILWRGWRRNEGLRRPVYAGELRGLHGMSQGLGLEAVPSSIVGWRDVPTNATPTTYPRDISLDLNYSVTSSLRASFSVNTDFAEVESDQRRVNLTRFPTRFPERRDFFLEGSGVFSFAPRSGPQPFFSRQIGLKSGQQIPIDYGTRVTGQVGPYEVGFYQIGTGEETYFDELDGNTLVPTERFTAARVKRRIFEQSAIGAIYTRRSTSEDASGFTPEIGHTAGIDLQMASRSFMGNNNAELEAFAVWNSNPDPTENLSLGDLSARGLRFNFPNDVWSGHLSYREFGSEYRPTLGFVTRRNYRRVEPRIGYSPRPESIDWIRSLSFSAQFRNQTQLGTGVLEEREWNFTVLGVRFESGDNVNFSVKRTYEYLDFGYDVSEGISIEPGEYTNWEYSVRGGTAGRRRVSVFGGINRSGFWNGTRTNFGGRITFRPRPGVSIGTNLQINKVALPQGSFDANLYEVETDWSPTPWISTTGQLRYDDQTQLVGLFARLRWILKPGNDLFLVYTHNWQNLGANILDDRDLITLSRGGSVKMNYVYRF
ncbi:MAG: carbohydrate binding family 9 domain-containing protein [Gemmatimonadetes bacterium]|nr:carbohydrate binding family 9 domain-containing protein [Gemmatimonadota bacterium]